MIILANTIHPVPKYTSTSKIKFFCNMSQFPEIIVDKAVANGPVGQVLAETLFLKVKTKFHFIKSK